MDTAQIVGAVINRDRYQIASDITDSLMQSYERPLAEFGLSQETLMEYALHDLSKLFVAIISHRPQLFRKYVEWQRSVFHHRDVPSAAIQFQLETLENTLADYLEPEHLPIVSSIIDEAYAALQSIMAPAEPYLHPEAPHAELAAAYLAHLLEREDHAAIASVESAVEDGLPLSEAYLHVIQPVQREIGRLWQINTLSVSGEHFATEASRQLMARLRGRFAPTERRDQVVVTACLGGELHDMGARMVSDFLHLAGFQSLFVGANTPHHAIIAELERSNADVLALSATMTLQVRVAFDLIDRVRERFGRTIRVLVGGYAFSQSGNLWRDVGADAYGESADEAVRAVLELGA